jgi:glycosyltransferase involved in cell wall biosynthesis
LIYICIPAYNEAATIGVLLWKIRQVMGEFPRDYELLVMNDASTDQTEDVLAPYLRVLPLSVLRSEQRLGYAASLERLIREAVGRASHPRRDVVVTLQADFSEPPEDIPTLVKRIEGGADVVEAVVDTPSGPSPWGLRWTRWALPWVLRRAHLPEGARQPVSGYRAYRVAVLKKALAESNGDPLLSREGWAANVELLLAVAPFTRRVDGAEIAARSPRRQRETRFRAWDTLVQVWEVGRRARHEPPPVTSPDAAG